MIAVQEARRTLLAVMNEVLRRQVEPGRYTSATFTDRLVEAAINALIGAATGNSYDDALTWPSSLCDTELIKTHGKCRTVDQIEVATLEKVAWFDQRRPLRAPR
ncbi:hypothetical protein B2J88_17610 [Rhodococcus sp. SRB_17]|nr:hypothetical protein [Rhodococcus sp. SRB_17]